MIREAPAMTVRQNLGELLNEVQYRHGKVLITKAGKPVAALVDIAMFTRLRKLDDEFDRMRAELGDGRSLALRAGRARYVGRLFVALPLGVPLQRTLLVSADMLDPHDFRRLRIWALWGRLPGVAAQQLSA